MKKIDVQKEILKSKVDAHFSHYCAGNLYYTVSITDGTFQFPVPTVESVNDGNFGIKLSSDLGTTAFDATIKGSFLNRWIGKAIDNGEFIKV